MEDVTGKLPALRDRIDEIDSQLVKLYCERMEVSGSIAEVKQKAGMKIYDPAREEEKIKKVKAQAGDELGSFAVGELFRQIMSVSKKIQYKKLEENGAGGRLPFICVDELFSDNSQIRVVFQGAKGSYSEAAMYKYFGKEVPAFHVDSFREAMAATSEGSADFAVLPIENSTAGTISEIYDLLDEFENYVVGEQIIPIRHCLLGLEDATIE
ncbi:MAG: chorismate mutase, partial [Lachnospiraceae bacterium]|nr:chorismate mutase [Lachnospiraceae bacterium]